MEACEWRSAVEIVKVDDEARIVAGFASVAINADGSLPEDTQGDVIDTPEAIKAWERAFYKYALDGRDGDVQHEFFKVSRLVELLVFTPEKTKAIAKRLGLKGDSQAVAAYVSYEVSKSKEGDKAWADVKAGKLPMFSIVASGKREDLPDAA